MFFRRSKDKQTMRFQAFQMGLFRSRKGIYEYYVTFEGLSPKEALELTKIECEGRGIGETLEEDNNSSWMENIKGDVTNHIVSYVKEDPGKAISEAVSFLSGFASTATGLFVGSKTAQSSNEAPTEIAPSDPHEDNEDRVSISDILSENEDVQQDNNNT